MQFDPAILAAVKVSLSEDRDHIVIRSDRGAHSKPESFWFGKSRRSIFSPTRHRSKLPCGRPMSCLKP